MAPTSSSTTSNGSLHLYSSRRSTFNKTRKGVNRALNWPHALTAAAAKVSTIHPDHLAHAGFHCVPTVEAPTRSACFSCRVEIEQWTEGDDPDQIHLDQSPTCGYAVLRYLTEQWPDGIRDKKEWDRAWGQESRDSSLWPNSARMQSARLASFQVAASQSDLWPHDSQSGVPSPASVSFPGGGGGGRGKQGMQILSADADLTCPIGTTVCIQIAAAGWFYRPGSGTDSDDNCICPYCTRTVEGWERGDNPV
jgi:hypothetical protein